MIQLYFSMTLFINLVIISYLEICLIPRSPRNPHEALQTLESDLEMGSVVL